MNIAIGSDHRGLDYKKYVIGWITDMGYSYKDFGSYTAAAVDYPDIAKAVGEAVAKSEFDSGILICGTGIGMSIAANKVKGIRAGLAVNEFMAVRSRQHNNANILCLGAENDESQLAQMVKAFLTTEFEGGRHQTRVDEMTKMEKEL